MRALTEQVQSTCPLSAQFTVLSCPQGQSFFLSQDISNQATRNQQLAWHKKGAANFANEELNK
jgi:hypothetical protein